MNKKDKRSKEEEDDDDDGNIVYCSLFDRLRSCARINLK